MKKFNKPRITRGITSKIVHTNDAINICYEASKSCVAGKIVYDAESRETYIGKRVKEAHESVLEHSNIVMLLDTPAELRSKDLIEFLSCCRYIKTCVKVSKSGDRYYTLVGGSIRGYKNCIRDMYDQTNRVLTEVKSNLCKCVSPAFMLDLIDSGAFTRSDFGTAAYIDSYHLNGAISEIDGFESYRNPLPCKYPKDFIEFINVDPIEKIYNEVHMYGFTLLDIIDISSVTIKFSNMSRVITQQLTRHRNAITQESQRYVSSAGATFNTPDMFKPDKYNADHLYGIDLQYPDFPDAPIHMDLTLNELTKVLIPIYEQLMKQGLLKEDARYFLPQNTHSTVYMTFTVKSLFEFLRLRCDSHAQAEIRKYADAIKDTFMGYWYSMFGKEYTEKGIDTIIKYLTPKFMYGEAFGNIADTEEAVGDPEEVSIDKEHELAVPDIVDDDDDATDFGMRKEKPTAVDRSDKAVEEMYKRYNPSTYADTRLPEEV